MTTAFRSILKIVGLNVLDIAPEVNNKDRSEDASKDLFVIGIGLEQKSNLILETHLKALGISSFSLAKNAHDKSKVKALAHAAKIKYSPDEASLLMPQKDFYWDQIFETRQKMYNAILGLSAINFCTDLIQYYSQTHECRVIFINENTQHWHRLVFNNLYNLENIGFAKDELDYLLYPQIEIVRQMTSNYHSDIKGAKKESQNAFDASLRNLKNQIPSEMIFEYNLSDGIKPLSQFLGIKPQRKVFGW